MSPIKFYSFVADSIRIIAVLLLWTIYSFSFSQDIGSKIDKVEKVNEGIERDHVRVQLVAETQSIDPQKPFFVGVLFQMDEGWHIYWKNSGDSGQATKIDWKTPEQVNAGEILWPYPKRFEVLALASYGYEKEILLMSEFQLKQESTQELSIQSEIEWLACTEEICLPPKQATLNIKLAIQKPNQAIEPSRWRKHFRETRSKVPVNNFPHSFQTQRTQKNLVLEFQEEQTENPWQSLDFFPHSKEHSISKTLFDPASMRLTLQFLDLPYSKTAENQDNSEINKEIKGVLVAKDLSSQTQGVWEVQLDIPPLKEMTSQTMFTSLWIALVFAFVGGLILNGMPCVFPVLSLKVLGFVQQGGEKLSKIRLHGLVFSLGVLVSFWILVLLFLILRSTGSQIGWGFQLQSPTFVMILAVFFFLFALNLFGVFEIGTSLTRLGGKAEKHSGLGNSFFTGVFATAAATPCSAPFMGPALGFALTLSNLQAFLIFTFLAMGLASPYLIFSLFPKLLRFLPKPGVWMENFKQLMGFFLAATVIYLIWIFEALTDTSEAFILIVSLLFIAIAMWIYGRWGTIVQSFRKRWIARVFALVVFSLAIWIELLPASEQEWQEFSPSYLEELRAEGTPVFVDFTAKWCATCQSNKILVLNTQRAQELFQEKNVTLLKADWTRQDPTITQELERLGRIAVPVYALYRNSHQEPLILPEILTESILKEALDTLDN